MSDAVRPFGLSCALVTPFQPDGTLAYGRFAEHAGWALSQGCSSVTAFGTTGEGACLGTATRERALGALLGTGIGPERIVGGVAASAVEDAAAQAEMALDAGARAVLVPPPFYFKNPGDEGLFRWFAALFERLGARARDVILYNIPSVTAVALSVDLVSRLRTAFPGIVIGVKDSSGDWPYTQALLAAHRDLIILVGDERHLAHGVRLGAQGAISGLANVMPDVLLPLARDGREDPRVGEIVELVLAHPVTPAVKALAAHRTGERAWLTVRAPLVALEDEAAATLGQRFAACLAKAA